MLNSRISYQSTRSKINIFSRRLTGFEIVTRPFFPLRSFSLSLCRSQFWHPFRMIFFFAIDLLKCGHFKNNRHTKTLVVEAYQINNLDKVRIASTKMPSFVRYTKTFSNGVFAMSYSSQKVSCNTKSKNTCRRQNYLIKDKQMRAREMTERTTREKQTTTASAPSRYEKCRGKQAATRKLTKIKHETF